MPTSFAAANAPANQKIRSEDLITSGGIAVAIEILGTRIRMHALMIAVAPSSEMNCLHPGLFEEIGNSIMMDNITAVNLDAKFDGHP